MRVLVTGGAGFLGAHVVRRLVDLGHDVVVVDRLDHGRPAWLPPVPLLVHDVREWEVLAERVGAADVLLHLAAQASVPAGEAHPVPHLEDNVVATQAALCLADALNVREFRLASTAAVYGNPETLPLAEDLPLKPISVYGIAKAAAEWLTRHWAARHGRPAVILRPGNIYGPGQRGEGEGGVVAQFCRQLREGRPLRRFGDGYQTRDFIYVADAAAAFCHRLGNPGTNGALVLNLGTGVATSVNTLGSLLAAAAERPLAWEDRPPRPADIRHAVFDIRRLKAWGFTPTTSLAEGLSRTWEADLA
jgi:UDP-glucose 4-epimerase